MDCQDTQHELWLSMRAAYKKYTYASEALVAVASRMPISISDADESPRMAMLAVEQRVAFENYIEARLQYSEFDCTQDRLRTENSKIPQLGERPEIDQGTGNRFRWLLIGLSGIALAGIIALRFDVMRERKDVRDRIAAPLSQGQQALQSAAGKLDGVEATTPMPQKIVGPPRSQVTNRIPRKQAEQSERILPHRSYVFSLTPSRTFKEVGPLYISLRRVDNRRQKAYLLVERQDSQRTKIRVGLHKPIWVTAAGGSRRIELVATQIRRNYVLGFVNEAQNYKSEILSNRRRVIASRS